MLEIIYFLRLGRCKPTAYLQCHTLPFSVYPFLTYIDLKPHPYFPLAIAFSFSNPLLVSFLSSTLLRQLKTLLVCSQHWKYCELSPWSLCLPQLSTSINLALIQSHMLSNQRAQWLKKMTKKDPPKTSVKKPPKYLHTKISLFTIGSLLSGIIIPIAQGNACCKPQEVWEGTMGSRRRTGKKWWLDCQLLQGVRSAFWPSWFSQNILFLGSTDVKFKIMCFEVESCHQTWIRNQSPSLLIQSHSYAYTVLVMNF